PRYLPVGDAGAARGPGRFQVPAVPAAGEVRRGRLGRPQGQARLLRLFGRASGSDAIGPPPSMAMRACRGAATAIKSLQLATSHRERIFSLSLSNDRNCAGIRVVEIGE